MRTIQLLKSLSQKELKLIEKQVHEGKRKSLVPLFKELKRSLLKGTQISNPDMFKKTFGTAYEKRKDYLLRNELRLLNDIIYRYLVEDSLKGHLAKNKGLFNRWLAQSLYDRQSPLFAEDISSHLKQATKNLQLDEASAMYALRSLWDSAHPVGDRKAAVEHVKEWKYEEERRFLHRLRRIEFSEHFFEKFAKAAANALPDTQTDDWGKPGAVMIDLSAIDKSDWYTHYLNMQIRYAQSKGEAQMNYLLQMVKVLNSEPAQGVITDENRLKAIMGLALNLGSNKKYEQADKYMKEAVALSKKKHIPLSPQVILSYMINSISFKHPRQTIDTYNEYKNLLHTNTNHSQGVVIAAYANLFMTKPDEALEMISQPIELLPIEALHPRYIYLIAFIIRKQYDLAKAELKNLKRMLAQPDSPFHVSELPIVGYFQTYLRLLESTNARREIEIEKLKSETGQTLTTYAGILFSNIQLVWLASQLA